MRKKNMTPPPYHPSQTNVEKWVMIKLYHSLLPLCLSSCTSSALLCCHLAFLLHQSFFRNICVFYLVFVSVSNIRGWFSQKDKTKTKNMHLNCTAVHSNNLTSLFVMVRIGAETTESPRGLLSAMLCISYIYAIRLNRPPKPYTQYFKQAFWVFRKTSCGEATVALSSKRSINLSGLKASWQQKHAWEILYYVYKWLQWWSKPGIW